MKHDRPAYARCAWLLIFKSRLSGSTRHLAPDILQMMAPLMLGMDGNLPK